jgi:mRNA-degrading endonuclease YafQ of YafQ-DinJ toxin-antitoxin module
VKYRTTGAFDRDFARLPTEHQQMLLKVLREHFLPAIDAGSFTGVPPWPKRLRVHQLVGSVYSITWYFTGPDGRATFHLDRDETGHTVLVWRRIGTHTIYDRP